MLTTSPIIDGLGRLAALQPNWDSYGADLIDPEIIRAAREFAQQLPEDMAGPPSVVPIANGSLQFEWDEGPRSLEFEFEDIETIGYLKWHPEEGIEDEGVLGLNEIDKAISLLRWLTKGTTNV